MVYRVGVRVAHKRRASKSPPKGLKRVGQDSGTGDGLIDQNTFETKRILIIFG